MPKFGQRLQHETDTSFEKTLKNRASATQAHPVELAAAPISDMALWGRVNTVYAKFFGEHRPARAVVPTRELHHGFKIEIEAIAAVA
ncbi:MAG: RidA family protein [Gemmataceae bacterium]|nr:RidA family protein [Gemmataceae bacterium]